MRSIELQEEALSLRRGLGDPLLVSDATYHLGVSLFRSGARIRARQVLSESLTIASDLGETAQRAAALFVLAELDLAAGDLEPAERQVRESLDIYTELENDRDRAECVVVLAGVALARGSSEHAARLLGAADTLRGAAPLDVFELAVLESYEAELTRALGLERFAELRLEGAGMGPADFDREVVTADSEE